MNNLKVCLSNRLLSPALKWRTAGRLTSSDLNSQCIQRQQGGSAFLQRFLQTTFSRRVEGLLPAQLQDDPVDLPFAPPQRRSLPLPRAWVITRHNLDVKYFCMIRCMPLRLVATPYTLHGVTRFAVPCRSVSSVARAGAKYPLFERPVALQVTGQELLAWRQKARQQIIVLSPQYQGPDTGPTVPELQVRLAAENQQQVQNRWTGFNDTAYTRGSSTGCWMMPVQTLSGSSAWVPRAMSSPCAAPHSSWTSSGTNAWWRGTMGC